MNFSIQTTSKQHFKYAQAVCDLIADSAKVRGTGIAKRKPKYIKEKMESGNSIIALMDNNLAGFCYIETWDHGKYVAHSGLIVSPNYRKQGLAKMIKAKAFDLAQTKYPEAKIFGITTSLAVMKINSELGYKPVTFSELTQDEIFWSGCQSCPNYDILQRNNRKLCLCTGMLVEST
ncbi:GNAT family N-acetyltransferase [Saprospiraceae bacterium]|jgi:N-acetylglutamate synthase-like GNAT family acetyltransferase|nr:GNAT family N-acetyltransferase [Bacteroidota bacterium]MDB4727190.1 GNAT family N-acetyltransferase [Saprospiraceae bacterium]MDF1866572.1 GNAT family N-acetyltransferase [Saprospiraceae bacterium]